MCGGGERGRCWKMPVKILEYQEEAGSEPQLISDVMTCLGPYIAGAGGGGFLAAVLKTGVDRDKAVEEVREIPGTERLTIDRQGITVLVENAQS